MKEGKRSTLFQLVSEGGEWVAGWVGAEVSGPTGLGQQKKIKPRHAHGNNKMFVIW